jgi:hypothetical protein
VNYTYVIEQAAAELVLELTKRERRVFQDIFEGLARDPFKPADFSERSIDGRDIFTLMTGPYSISYWIDHATREVRIAVVQMD